MSTNVYSCVYTPVYRHILHENILLMFLFTLYYNTNTHKRVTGFVESEDNSDEKRFQRE